MDEYLEERARHSTEEHPWQPQLLIIGNVMKPKRILAIVDLLHFQNITRSGGGLFRNIFLGLIYSTL